MFDSDDFQLDKNACADDRATECVKWSSTVVFLDNTGTRFNESHEITITNVDGTTTVVNAAPTTGWTPQLNEWQSIFQAAYPDAIVEVRCNLQPAGCGGLLPPPADAQPSSAIQWRYLSMIHCPTDQKIPVSATITDSSNPARIGNALVYDSVSTPEKRGYRCVDCEDGYGTLHFEDGTEVPESDLPVCVFACAETIPQPPASACEFDALDGGCDNVNSADQADWVTITRVVSICEGSITVNYYVVDPADPSALVDYTLVGDFVDCDTGEIVPEPPKECDTPSIVVCADPCAEGSTYIFGRPPASQPWAWGPYSGDNLSDFEDSLAAGGYNVLQVNEKHQICPPFGAFGEDPSAELLVNGSPSSVTIEANIDPDFVPEDLCAEVTTGCNDDRRDNLLTSIDDTLDSLLADCAEAGDGGSARCTDIIPADALNVSTKVGINGDNSTITFAVLAPWTLAQLAAELNASAVHGTGWTVSGDQLCTDDATVTSLDLVSIPLTFPLGDVGGETGEAEPALRMIGCLDQDILDKLCDIADLLDADVDITVAYVCSDDTDTWLEIVSVDGVAGDPVDTGIPCSEPIPDPPEIESSTECRDGTLHTVFYTVAVGSEPVEVGVVDTGEPCVETTCVTTTTGQVVAAGDTGSLAAGGRYTIFVTSDGFELDGVPIPCGATLTVPDCCGCTLEADTPIANTGVGDITIIGEASTQVASAERVAVNAQALELVRSKAFVKAGKG